jgi:hypothetical protein
LIISIDGSAFEDAGRDLRVSIEEAVMPLEPALRDEEGNWIADYVRLRFIARA